MDNSNSDLLNVLGPNGIKTLMLLKNNRSNPALQNLAEVVEKSIPEIKGWRKRNSLIKSSQYTTRSERKPFLKNQFDEVEEIPEQEKKVNKTFDDIWLKMSENLVKSEEEISQSKNKVLQSLSEELLSLISSISISNINPPEKTSLSPKEEQNEDFHKEKMSNQLKEIDEELKELEALFPST